MKYIFPNTFVGRVWMTIWSDWCLKASAWHCSASLFRFPCLHIWLYLSQGTSSTERKLTHSVFVCNSFLDFCQVHCAAFNCLTASSENCTCSSLLVGTIEEAEESAHLLRLPSSSRATSSSRLPSRCFGNHCSRYLSAAAKSLRCPLLLLLPNYFFLEPTRVLRQHLAPNCVC